jgi:hypothetical protein
VETSGFDGATCRVGLSRRAGAFFGSFIPTRNAHASHRLNGVSHASNDLQFLFLRPALRL